MEKLNTKEFLKEYNAGRKDFSNCDLRGLNLKPCDLSAIIFNGANLSNSSLNGCIFKNAQFACADLSSSSLIGTNFQNAEMDSVNLADSDLREANLDEANIDAGILNRANLNKASLNKTRLNHALLQYVSFEMACLNNALLFKADLYKANLEGSFEGTILANADLTKANLNKVIAKPSGSSTNVKDKSLKSKIELKCKKVGKEIIFRSTISNAALVAQNAILELLSLLGVKKSSKFYKFFANNIGNVVVKTSAGLFLKYCPFTQEEKYQSIANELLTQVGVSSMKEARNILIGFIPQAKKLVGMVEALMEEKPVTRIAISENKPEISEEIQEEEQLIEDKELYIQ